MGNNHTGNHGETEGFVNLPTPTIWPMILALGISLAITGLVTHWVISLLGICLVVPAAVGWFSQVLPHELHEPVAVSTEIVTISSDRIASVHHHVAAGRREVEPLENYSIWIGVKGGLAGGVAMTIPATIFGLLKYHSVWFPINLLAAGGFVSWATESDAFLSQFHMQGLLAASAIHIFTSLLVGLLYGAMLPMFPRRPIITCGFIAPFLWTGILYTSLGVLSPILDQRISWGWFFISQVAFGLVAGFVVNLQVKVRSEQFSSLPFAVRAGLHTDQSLGIEDDRKGEPK
jgi:hypothetical protein